MLIPDRRRLLAGRFDHRARAARVESRAPRRVVVSYVNTTAAIKAESDYCVTSGNAEAVVRSIPEDREILFLPDVFLGAWLKETHWSREHAHLDGRVPRPRRRSGPRRSARARRPIPMPTC